MLGITPHFCLSRSSHRYQEVSSLPRGSLVPQKKRKMDIWRLLIFWTSLNEHSYGLGHASCWEREMEKEEEEKRRKSCFLACRYYLFRGKLQSWTLCFPSMPIPFVFHSTSFSISAALPLEQVQLSFQMFPFATIGETRGIG